MSSVGDRMEKSKQHLSEEDDYHLQSFFPKTLSRKIEPLIEHRVKLLMKDDVTFNAGEMETINTRCIISGKLKGAKMNMFLIPAENMFGLSLLSSGFVSCDYRGRILLKLGNFSESKIMVQKGSLCAYLVLTPYSLEM